MTKIYVLTYAHSGKISDKRFFYSMLEAYDWKEEQIRIGECGNILQSYLVEELFNSIYLDENPMEDTWE